MIDKFKKMLYDIINNKSNIPNPYEEIKNFLKKRESRLKDLSEKSRNLREEINDIIKMLESLSKQAYIIKNTYEVI